MLIFLLENDPQLAKKFINKTDLLVMKKSLPSCSLLLLPTCFWLCYSKLYSIFNLCFGSSDNFIHFL